MSRRGHDRERDVAELLESWDWVCVRAAGSLGPADVLAVGGELARWEGGQPSPLQWQIPLVLMCEVKSTAKSPYEKFGRSEREELIVLAAKCGAIPVLAWWPPARNGQSKVNALQWLWERDWPR